MTTVYVCSDTITGMYSALYDAWRENRNTDAGIALKGQIQQKLFCDYRVVQEDEKKALCLERMIQKNLGHNAYWYIWHALLADSAEKAEAVFRTLQEARRIKDSRKIMEHLGNPDVAKVFELSRKVLNEAHQYKEFVRFRELENKVLFSEIRPRAQILLCLSDHFANRFPLENWMIYDATHEIMLFHQAGKNGEIILEGKPDVGAVCRVSESEKTYEQLWKGFFDSISIRERYNPELQRTHLPLRYREYMPEFCNGSRIR